MNLLCGSVYNAHIVQLQHNAVITTHGPINGDGINRQKVFFFFFMMPNNRILVLMHV